MSMKHTSWSSYRPIKDYVFDYDRRDLSEKRMFVGDQTLVDVNVEVMKDDDEMGYRYR